MNQEPIAYGVMIRAALLILAQIIGTSFTEGETDTIVNAVLGVVAVVSMLTLRAKVTPVDKAAKNAAQVVRHETGSQEVAAKVAATIRNGTLPPSVKR